VCQLAGTLAHSKTQEGPTIYFRGKRRVHLGKADAKCDSWELIARIGKMKKPQSDNPSPHEARCIHRRERGNGDLSTSFAEEGDTKCGRKGKTWSFPSRKHGLLGTTTRGQNPSRNPQKKSTSSRTDQETEKVKNKATATERLRSDPYNAPAQTLQPFI